MLLMASGLREIHRNSGSHGNLKPQNVLIYPDRPVNVALGGLRPGLGPSQVRQRLEEVHSNAVVKWCKGEMSNFDYIISLNHMCGRREEDPAMQPIFPWVIDFSGPKAYRDLTKSKYRYMYTPSRVHTSIYDVLTLTLTLTLIQAHQGRRAPRFHVHVSYSSSYHGPCHRGCSQCIYNIYYYMYMSLQPSP